MVKAFATLLLALSTGWACAQSDHAAMQKMDKAPRPSLGTSVAYAPDGELLAVSTQGSHVVLQRSRDNGRSWSVPTPVNAVPEAISADGENRPKLAVLKNGNIVVTWSHPLPKRFTGLVKVARSEDGGNSFGPPMVVHRDLQEIAHSFDTLLVADDRVYITWIDKRDGEAAKAQGKSYRGSAIYAAVSTDGGRSFAPEVRVADHSCECCRIAATTDIDGAPLLFWRHVFEPNQRDHALAKLNPDGTAVSVTRATFDRWQIDACPHHGPALAVANDGTRHAVWFNRKDDDSHVFYGRLRKDSNGARVEGQQKVGGARAAHADIAVSGQRVAIAWKEFDGEKTRLRAQVSSDGGLSFLPLELTSAEGASDQPRLLKRGELLHVFWRTEREGMRLFDLP